MAPTNKINPKLKMDELSADLAAHFSSELHSDLTGLHFLASSPFPQVYPSTT